MSKKEFFPERVPVPTLLLEELRGLIAQSHANVVATVNSVMSMLYWEMGQRINADILKKSAQVMGRKLLLLYPGHCHWNLEKAGAKNTFAIVYALRRLFKTKDFLRTE